MDGVDTNRGLLSSAWHALVSGIVNFLKEGILMPVLLVLAVFVYWKSFLLIGALPADGANKPLLYVFATTGFSAWLTFILSQVQTARHTRRNQTLMQMMQLREGPNYQRNLRIFHALWDDNNPDRQTAYVLYTSWRDGSLTHPAEDEDKQLDDRVISSSLIKSISSGDGEKIARIETAEALLQLINYYEFLAAGITKRVYDEQILKETIRGMFCNFAYHVEPIVKEVRKKNQNKTTGESKVWENFAYLYFRWEDEGPRKQNMHLGPKVSDEIVNIGFMHFLTRLKVVTYAWVLKIAI